MAIPGPSSVANGINHINACIRSFISRYRARLPQLIHFETDDALVSFQSAVDTAGQTPHRLYLFIDEYDNFANEVMAAQPRVGATGMQRWCMAKAS